MYLQDILHDLNQEKTIAQAQNIGGEVVYYEYLSAKLINAERFYIGDVQKAIDSLNIEKLHKEHLERIGKDKEITDIYKMPFPLTYISFDCPEIEHTGPNIYEFTKGAVLFEEPPEKEKMNGFLFRTDCLFWLKKRRAWFPDGMVMIQRTDGYQIFAGTKGMVNLPEGHGETVVEENALHTSARVVLSLLLNCKNIGVETIEPPKSMNRKRARRGELPLLSYNVLKIKKLGSEGNGKYGPGDGLSRVHLCRGHFKYFTEDKPLFGKYTGMYWWQPQVRGNRSKGIVKKRYELDPEDFTT